VLPALAACGVKAIKVEGRQRSPAYVGQVTGLLRRALDLCAAANAQHEPADGASEAWSAPADLLAALDALAEGRTHTLGAYHRPWQ